MSLVAYAESDDGSDDSEGEATSPQTSSLSSDKSSTAILQEAVNSTFIASEELPSKNTGKRSCLSSLLPKPNNPDNVTTITKTDLLTLDIQNSNDEDEILEIEEEYVPLSQIGTAKKVPIIDNKEEHKSVGSLFSRMPSPWSLATGITLGKKTESEGEVHDKNKKSKQPVIIVAPSQADLEDDDGDDSNDIKGPAAKRPKKSNTGSCLSSLLPKPKHSVSVTAHNPNKPSAKLQNRTLIPHTLAKKPIPAKKDTKNPKKLELGGDSGDEDDREPVSFFSFGDQESDKTKDFDKVEFKTSTSLNILEETKQIDSQHSYNKSNTICSVPEVPRAEYSTSMSFETPGMEVSPKVSYGEVAGSSVSYGNTSDTLEHYDYNGGAVTTYYPPATDTTKHITYYETYTENPQAAYHSNNIQGIYNQTCGGHVQEETQNNQADDIDLEKLKKLQGKRHRNEQINIIDINAADQTGDTQLQMTKRTSEQITHLPSKKKGSMPSSQQRRKHQITYLAFQAKEREFELQQQWATNRQTKKQTQAKYGF